MTASRLTELNGLAPGAAEAVLLRCCGSRAWARRVVSVRPFADEAALHAAAERGWRAVSREDRLEAFGCHPRIGEKHATGKPHPAWAEQEQRGMRGAEASVLAALAAGNREYERKFGYIFLVCATGKAADEMLALLQARLGNDPEAELSVASGEQAKITRIRLEKWLKQDEG